MTSATAKPRLSTQALTSKHSELAELAKELDPLHGSAVTLQNETGGQTAVRVNRASLTIEAFIDGRWQTLGG